MNHVFYYKKDPGVCTTGACLGRLAVPFQVLVEEVEEHEGVEYHHPTCDDGGYDQELSASPDTADEI